MKVSAQLLIWTEIRRFLAHAEFCHSLLLTVMIKHLSLIKGQRINIKSFVKLGKNGREISHCLKQFNKNSSLKVPTANKQLKRFREGREGMKDSPCPSISSYEENVEPIRVCVGIDRRLIVRMVADNLPISKPIVHESRSEVFDSRTGEEVCFL